MALNNRTGREKLAKIIMKTQNGTLIIFSANKWKKHGWLKIKRDREEEKK